MSDFKFEVGQTIICVNPDGNILVKGGEYKVRNVGVSMLTVDGVNGEWMFSRFAIKQESNMQILTQDEKELIDYALLAEIKANVAKNVHDTAEVNFNYGIIHSMRRMAIFSRNAELTLELNHVLERVYKLI
jgi:hypothetical protein